MILEAAQPTNPGSFGELLRSLRAERGLALQDITAVTKISHRVLVALEEGRFERLPERIFSRSFVRQIAELLDGDPAAMVRAFDLAWEQHLSESGEHEVIASVEPPPRPAIRWRFWFPISVCGLVVGALSIVILSGSEPGQAALVEQPRRPISGAVAAAEPAEAVLGPSVVADEPVAADEPIELRVLVADEQECWVRYRDREGRTGQRLVPGGHALALSLDGPVKLTVGNASAARLVVDGVEYGGLGVPGQVVHAEVSRRGVTTLGAGPHYD